MRGSPGAFEMRQTSRRAAWSSMSSSRTDLPQVDYIELFNTTTQAVNLTGAWLSDDDAGTNKYQIANGTTIPARGFLAFTQAQLGFALTADGEAIYLVNSNQTRVLDAVKFDGQENGVSWVVIRTGEPGLSAAGQRDARQQHAASARAGGHQRDHV